jgi:phage-related protein
MINKRHLLVRNAVAILAATPWLWIAPAVNAQTSSPSPQESKTSQNSDITRQELVRFDLFLDNHQDIDQALRREPSLVNDSDYLQAHPDLQTFLQNHPAIREEIKENPNYFMRQENRYEQREDARALAQFDQFLGSHHEISEQLRRDPSLANNQQYVDSHPALQAFLRDHTEVRQDLSRNPNGYMQQTNQYESRENPNSDLARNRVDNRQDNDAGQDRDMDRRDADRRDVDRRDDDRRAQLAQFDRFLDTHRETAERLRSDPSLVKNQQFLQNHPALQTYLQQHPDIQRRLDQNPNAFMRQEDRYDNNEAEARNRDFDRDARRDNDRNDMHARDDDRRDADNRRANDNRQDVHDRDADNRNDNRQDNDYRQDTRNRDRDHGQVVSFDQFLDKHQEIAEQLRRDPSLAKNQQFVQNHPALQAYLQDHQGVREELNQNPNAFMQQQNRYESRENGMDRSGMNREQYRFAQFLGTHSSMSEELSKNPSLLKNREYVSSHPELDAYLKAHPDAQSQVAKDPDSFLKASQQFSSTTKTGTTASTTGTTGSATKTTTTTPPSTSTTNTTKPPKQ